MDTIENTPAPWAIVEDDAIIDRFFTEDEARDAIDAGGYPDEAEVAYVNDPGPLA